MRRDRTLRRSLLFLAIMFVMIFAMSITASAAATNIKQVSGSQDSVEIKWSSNSSAQEYYKVYYSTSENGQYYVSYDFASSYADETIYDLNAGSTYYVKVVTYIKDSYYDDVEIATSAPFQVVTAPKEVKESTIKQTDGTSTSATIKWSAVKGATGYIIEKRNNGSVKHTSVRTNSIKLKASSGQKYDVNVISFRKSRTGFVAKSYSATKYDVVSSPSSPVGFAKASLANLTWETNSKTNNKPMLRWDRNSKDQTYPDGYQIEFYTVDGKKKIASVKTTNTFYSLVSSKNYKLMKNKGFKTRIRAYIKNNGIVCYSKWTGMTTVIPQAAVGMDYVGNNTVKVTWPRVANAVKYRVYVSRDSGIVDSGHWAKKEISAKSNAYYIKGLKTWKNFAVYVLPVVKVNGKQYIASRTYYTYSTLRTR